MATKQSAYLNRKVYQGEDGNVSKEGFVFTFAANAIGDVVQGRYFPAGCKITGVEYVNAALGTSVTLDVKIGDTTLVSGLSVSTAGSGYKPVESVITTTDNTVLSAVVGGGAATGKATIRVHYEYIGTV